MNEYTANELIQRYKKRNIKMASRVEQLEADIERDAKLLKLTGATLEYNISVHELWHEMYPEEYAARMNQFETIIEGREKV